MNPRYLPYARVHLRTTLGRQATLQRLDSRRLAAAGFELADVAPESFKLIRVQQPFRQIPYLPVVSGRLTEGAGGTDVRLVFSIKPSELLVLLSLFAFFGVISSMHAGEGAVFLALGLFSYHGVGMLCGFLPSRRECERLLTHALVDASDSR